MLTVRIPRISHAHKLKGRIAMASRCWLAGVDKRFRDGKGKS